MTLKFRATRQPSRKPGRDRYEQILDAAGRLIVSENSLEGLTLQSVAHEAGVPRVSLYYFFPSIKDLIDALYQRGVERLMNEVKALPDSSDWRELMRSAIDSSASFFGANRLEMVLSLSPYSVQFTEKVNPEIGRSIHAALVNQAGIASNARVVRAFELVGDIADTIWRRSFIKHGKITPSYNKHVHEAVLSFLTEVLEGPNSAR